MSKDKRLGRGLDALFGKASASEYTFNAAPAAVHEMDPAESERLSLYDGGTSEGETDKILGDLMKGKTVYEVPVDKIDRNPYQPRQDFPEDELAELSESLQKHGLIQPIVLRQKEGRFELIVGERRFRAAQKAGWDKIPAHLLEADDREMAELALTENIQRRDLNAIEKAIAFRNYLDVYGGTQDDLAKRLGLDRSTIANLIRLLELPQELQMAVRKNELTQGHVRALLSLEESEQFDVAKKIKEEGWSVRQTEKYVRELIDSEDRDIDSPVDSDQSAENKTQTQRSEHLADLEQQFRSFFGMKVKLTSNEKGKGKLVISFNSNAEFNRIYDLIHSSRID